MQVKLLKSADNKRIFVAGHRGMVGSAIVRELARRGYRNIVTHTRAELDLTNQSQVHSFFASEAIDEVYLAAAHVGGIFANNTYPAQYIYDNLMVEANVIHEAWRSGIRRLLFLGSSCIYPRLALQPMREECLLTGPLEPTNEPYAIAKIAGIKLCESYNRQYETDFRSVMPTNLYGPGDNYHADNSHVIAGLIRRLHEAKIDGAKEVAIWGTGTPRREFLYVDDMARASVHVMELDQSTIRLYTTPMQSHINIGFGSDVTIRSIAEKIAEVVGYQGKIVYDTSKPDGAPRKLLDTSLMRRLGWMPSVPLESGLTETYQHFLHDHGQLEGQSREHALT